VPLRFTFTTNLVFFIVFYYFYFTPRNGTPHSARWRLSWNWAHLTDAEALPYTSTYPTDRRHPILGEEILYALDKGKAEDGAEATYRVAKDASIDTEHGVAEGSRYIAKEGEKVTVHHTEEAGEKVAHFIKHI